MPPTVSAARVTRIRKRMKLSGFTGRSIGPLTALATIAATGWTIERMKCLLAMGQSLRALPLAHLELVEGLADRGHAAVVALRAARATLREVHGTDRRVVGRGILHVLGLGDADALRVAIRALREGVILPRAVTRRVDALAEAPSGAGRRHALLPGALAGGGVRFPALGGLRNAIKVNPTRGPGAFLPIRDSVTDR